ncbi:hypothetical protein NDU88_004388 [Pleurodeles waltl]|uniref:SCP domain-containing protein n=1 Tax=Pleurodeles waltl TaxID=8319 RepID=A0AAV7RL80_PLEWA|nr:hypothetical protein NDU88_004388 [Pleurodeles waltl]
MAAKGLNAERALQNKCARDRDNVNTELASAGVQNRTLTATRVKALQNNAWRHACDVILTNKMPNERGPIVNHPLALSGRFVAYLVMAEDGFHKPYGSGFVADELMTRSISSLAADMTKTGLGKATCAGFNVS